MNAVTPVQTKTEKPQSAQSVFSGLKTQHKCACGGSSGLIGECREFQTKRLLGKPFQAKLQINEPCDEYEQEADRVADQVMRMPDSSLNTDTRKSPTTPLIQRKVAGRNTGIGEAPPIVKDVLASPGQPLDAATRGFFEPRFGHDFGNVRVHSDAKAAESAQVVKASAYTTGSDIVFGTGQYMPNATEGNRLLAHELAHVVQQVNGAHPILQRTEIMIENLSVTINFDHLYGIEEEEITGQILSMITPWVGPEYDEDYKADIAPLNSEAKRWVMFALQLLIDNNKNRSSGELASLFFRFVEYAPRAVHIPAEVEPFVREVFRIWGRLENVVASGLVEPDRKTRKKIKKNLKQQSTRLLPGFKKLNVEELRNRLVPALENTLFKKDPNNWNEPKGTRSLPVYQALGDILLEEARLFFFPYADATRSNIFTQTPQWKGSTHIYDASKRYDISTEEKIEKLLQDYLRNRAYIVGGNTDPSNSDFIDTNIFRDVSFNDNRESDVNALEMILEEMLKKKENDDSDTSIRNVVERLDRVTGTRQFERIGPVIGIGTTYDPTKYSSACDGHWKAIDTLCHEIIHAMVDPRFLEAVEEVNFDQIITEGFTEVLGAQLYNDHILHKANNNPEFKATVEAGVQGAPCSNVSLVTIDYGAAGKNAEKIRNLVGDDNFRAAYFLGKPELAGLPR